MKVCIVNSYYPPYIGGAESYARNLAVSLASKGHQVSVYCASKPLPAGVSMQEGVRVVRMRTSFTFYGTPLSLFSSSFLVDDFDIIHCGFPNPYFAAFSSFISRLTKTPAVLTWHNDLIPPTKAARIFTSAHDFLSPIYLEGYKKIIATTSLYIAKSKILSRYLGKIAVIPNGVDSKRFCVGIDGRGIREKYALHDKKVLLFVGALTKWHIYKGLDVLIKALALIKKRIRDAVLLVVGEGEMKNSYLSMAKELGVEDSIIFAGRVSDESLPSHYAASDVFVLPSLNSSEGYGTVLLEAMASGKAVVGSDVGGVSEVIKHGETGMLVKPGDHNSLAESLLRLLQDDRMRTMLGINGRNFAEQRDWMRIAGRIERIYEQVLRLES